MLFDVSYTNPEVTEAINAVVGKPFSLRKRFSLGVTGSQRYIVAAANETIWNKIAVSTKMPFCNIELRSKGIKIWFSIKLHTYLLALGYSDLSIAVQQGQLQLTTSNYWLYLKPAHNAQLNQKFIQKIKRLKREYPMT